MEVPRRRGKRDCGRPEKGLELRCGEGGEKREEVRGEREGKNGRKGTMFGQEGRR